MDSSSLVERRWYFGKIALIATGVVFLAIVLFVGGVFALFFTLGSRAARRELPNGYYIQPDWDVFGTSIEHAGLATLDFQDGPVVPAEIEQLAVFGDVVVGFVRFDYTDQNSRKEAEGWFVLDTRTGVCTTGLSKDKWVAALRAQNIDPLAVELKSPYSFPSLNR